MKPSEPNDLPDPTYGDFLVASGTAAGLAEDVAELRRRLRAADGDSVRRVGYRLDDIYGELRRISDGLQATGADLRRALEVQSNPRMCPAEWGVCPDHGNTLTSSGGITTCRVDGRVWDYDRLGSSCGEPVTEEVTDPAGTTNAVCHGHALAVPADTGWNVRPISPDKPSEAL